MKNLIGISGVARCGKDSLAGALQCLIEDELKRECQILSFASTLKNDIDNFIESKTGISAFTQDTEEKNFIRPLLVAYGMTMRTMNENYWILKLEPFLKANERNGIVSLITDVRFPNEVSYIQNFTNSTVVHLSRTKLDGSAVPPANEEEAENDPKCRDMCFLKLNWPTFKEEYPLYTEYVESELLPLLY